MSDSLRCDIPCAKLLQYVLWGLSTGGGSIAEGCCGRDVNISPTTFVGSDIYTGAHVMWTLLGQEFSGVVLFPRPVQPGVSASDPRIVHEHLRQYTCTIRLTLSSRPRNDPRTCTSYKPPFTIRLYIAVSTFAIRFCTTTFWE